MKNYKNITYEGYHPRILVTKEFTEKNNFKYCRTQEEILEEANGEGDFLGFGKGILIDYLDWKNAKEFYEDEFVKKVEGGKEKAPEAINDIYQTVQNFLDYMVFGWMKALDERGISASRTINKLSAWLWILGREDLAKMIDNDDLYNPYGTPALIKLCGELDIEAPEDLIKFSKVRV